MTSRLVRALRLVSATRRSLKLLRVGPEDPRFSRAEAGAVSGPWALGILQTLGFEVQLSGAPRLEEPGLLVSNHLSYLDILVWLAAAPCCFMAKQAVARAPLIGEGATRLGTVYVERGSTSSREAARSALSKAIAQGRQVVVFPEGTTSHENGSWRRGSFQVAADEGFWIQPAALAYSQPERCAYVERPFPAHIWDMLSARPARAYLHRFEPRKIQSVEELPGIHAEVDAWYQNRRRNPL